MASNVHHDTPNSNAQPPTRRVFSANGLGLLFGMLVGAGIVAVTMMSRHSPRQEGDPVPAFTVTTLDGQTVELEDLRGQIVVVNFWASWCAPCRAEAPDLQRIHETYHDQGVVVLGITHTETTVQDTTAFIDEFGLTYPNAMGTDTPIAHDFRIVGVPETFIIDTDGNLATDGHFPGAVRMAQLADVLDRLLVGEGDA